VCTKLHPPQESPAEAELGATPAALPGVPAREAKATADACAATAKQLLETPGLLALAYHFTDGCVRRWAPGALLAPIAGTLLTATKVGTEIHKGLVVCATKRWRVHAQQRFGAYVSLTLRTCCICVAGDER
jgi:hypothetical protein